MKKQVKIILSVLALGLGMSTEVNAQAGNFGTGYFQNQYVFNPAMAGLTAGELNINSAFNGETAGISNGAKTLYLTADYGLNDKTGLGVNLMMDKIGGLNTTRIMGSYTYGIKLSSDDQRLNFGLLAGGVVDRLNEIALSGDLSDQQLYNFNTRKMQFEADFGIAYLNKGFTLQATVPNLVSTLRDTEKTILSQNTFFASVGYKMGFGESKAQVNVEPKVAFRSMKNMKSIVDAGANVDFLQNTINVFALYHTSKSVTGGVGFKVLDAFQVSASYNSGSEALGGINAGNNYEIGLRFYTTKK